MTTFQIFEVKIEGAATKLDCEHVTKRLIHLDCSIPKWMALLTRLFSGCSMLAYVTVFLSLLRLKTYPRSTMGKSRIISLVFICVEHARLWQWSHSNQYWLFSRSHNTSLYPPKFLHSLFSPFPCYILLTTQKFLNKNCFNLSWEKLKTREIKNNDYVKILGGKWDVLWDRENSQ